MSAETKPLSDEALVHQFIQTGNKQVVGELFKRHSLMCFAVCVKYLKDEDAAQDAVMSIFEKLLSELGRHQVTNFRSWLHSVCRNYCLMQLRKPMNSLFVDLGTEENEEELMETVATVHLYHVETDKEEKLSALEQAILKLNQHQRVCVEFFYLKRMSYEEISQASGYTPNEVKSYIQNGKRNLKQMLTAQGISLAITLILWMQERA